jgi:branched-chain amino acid aminotransferase
MTIQSVASLNGVLSPLEKAVIPVLDRGFLYGDAVFEALRTYGGVPHALDEHVRRLFRSCAIVGIEPGVSAQAMVDEIERAVSAAGTGERYVRVVMSRGEGAFGLSPLGKAAAQRVVLVMPLSVPDPALYDGGIRVESVVSPPSRLVAGAKPTAYLSNLLALGHAQAHGAEDALLLGDHGELLEGATSSVFLVQGGELHTPTLAVGILPGITRDRVVGLSRSLGLVVRERLLTIHDAYRAHEVFLTSSVREIVAVTHVDGVCIGQGSPGPLSRRLSRAYRAQALGT